MRGTAKVCTVEGSRARCGQFGVSVVVDFADSRNKYVVDVDGNAWSSRFRRLLNSNHVVLKSTAYVSLVAAATNPQPEWFNDILVPWYHYVPIRHDYEDVYDIMAYFQGAPDKSTNGHDELAEQIAMNGVNFVKTHWR